MLTAKGMQLGVLVFGLLFSFSQGNAQTEAKLQASDGTVLNGNVSISGDYAILGGRGGALVFKWAGGSWVEQAKLTVPNESTSRFHSTDDGYVKIGSTKKYGRLSHLKVEGEKFIAYLRFEVAGLQGPVREAKIKLKVSNDPSSASDFGGELRLASKTYSDFASYWRERDLHWGNRPESSGPVLASVGAVAPNQVVEFDVTNVVKGNGHYSFQLSSPSQNCVMYDTHESSNPPELIIETGASAGPTDEYKVGISEANAVVQGSGGAFCIQAYRR